MTTKTTTKPASYYELRLLLAAVKTNDKEQKGNLTTLARKSSEKTQAEREHYQQAFARLEKCFIRTDNGYELTERGEAELRAKLQANADVLMPDADSVATVVGRKDYERLLIWLKAALSMTAPTPQNGAAAAGAIGSYEAFKGVALETYDALDREYNHDNLVPIYQIRRRIGEQVTRQQFNDWLLEMQAEDIFQLQGGSLPSNDQSQLEDSISTELSGLRCYARKLA